MSNKTLNQIKDHYNNNDDIDEYFNFLEQNELVFFTTEPNLYPSLELAWKSPSIITNAIIDFGKELHPRLEKVFAELNFLNCKALQLRFFQEMDISLIKKVLEYSIDGRLQHIELLIEYSKKINIEELKEFILNNNRIKSIVVHSAPSEKIFSEIIEDAHVYIYYNTNIINSSDHCGKIHPSYFTINQDTFLESLNYNSCLNKKIAIDQEGNIKNCPSLSNSYGNIIDTTLTEALEKEGFKKYWSISKNEIKICSDCEFRHICTDCRAFIEDAENIYSKPAKCSYDPYTATWKNPEDDPHNKFYKN